MIDTRGDVAVPDWIDAARGGDPEALGRLLEAFRPYLLAAAHELLPDDLRGKCGPSDLVQETMLEAHRDFARFTWGGPDDLRAWLRGILRNNLSDCVRHYRATGKRDAGRERPFQRGGVAAGHAGLVDPEPTPGTHAIAREEMASLDAALDRLLPDERAVILHRNRDHLGFEEIGRRMGRSSEAARKLWARSVARLQDLLERREP